MDTKPLGGNGDLGGMREFRAFKGAEPAMPVGVFHRILVASEGEEAAGSASALVAELAYPSGARVRFIDLTEESAWRRRGPVADMAGGRLPPSNHVTVRGATRGARNKQLVSEIADEALIFRADLIVLGFDRRRLAGHGPSRSVRDRLTEATDIPVMIAPRPTKDETCRSGTAAREGRDTLV